MNSILVADIGGTHARFGIAEALRGTRPKLSDRADFNAEDFPSFAAALRGYIQQIGLSARPSAAAIAAAGPVISGRVDLTNRSWSISESELRTIGFASVTLINDFAALSYAIPTLEPYDVHTIGPELEVPRSAPVSIVGAGTGFGVSCLVRNGAQALALITEGGHIGFAPTDDRQIQILQALRRQFGRVSVERILSGPGLENLHRIQQELAGRKAVLLSATELTARAMAGEPDSRRTLDLFCSIYGAVAGDVALAHGARGGLIVAGGIAQKIRSLLLESAFREHFENKGRLSHYVESIPTKLLIDADAALRGAAHAATNAWTP